VVSFFLSSFFPHLISLAADWMSTILPHMVWPLCILECRSEMCCTRLNGNAGSKKSPSGHHRTTLSSYIFATKARIDNRKKMFPPTCPHNMVNFGPLAAEIFWRVWGSPANFNGFRVLAALIHDSLVVGVIQTLRH